MKIFKNTVLIALCVGSFSPALAEEDLYNIINDGQVYGEARYRFEHINQDGFAKDASANTVRGTLGFKTGEYKGFQGLAEGSIVRHVGADAFDDTTNGKSQYPVIADPDNEELNQLWLSYGNIPDTSIKLGRQTIELDNQRFVGSHDWRQNDQTFDAIAVSNHSIDDLNLTYAFVGNVNRINGDDHPLGDLDTETHVFHGYYNYENWFDISGYSYLIDAEKASDLSSQTYGIRATGEQPINKVWMLSYEAEFAHQRDYANNSNNYDAEYYHLSPKITGKGITFGAGYELLGSDSNNAFQTPLGSSHAFNGWADQFVTTPDQGLEDIYLTVGYEISDLHDWVDGTEITGTYHHFDGDKSGDFGSEFNLGLTKTIPLENVDRLDDLVLTAKYADYRADDAPYSDKQVFWTQVGVTF